MNFIEIYGWVDPEIKKVGSYRTEVGLGISGLYRREYKKNYEMFILNKGHVLCRYKYPKIEIPFYSAMVRWQNLFFCGGYSLGAASSNDALFQAVIDGLKPIGFIMCKSEDVVKYQRQCEELGFPYRIHTNEFRVDLYEFAVSNNGTVKDHFDLEKLIESYRIMSKAGYGYSVLCPSDERDILKMLKKPLSYFLTYWDYANPRNNFQLVKTGLLLGYAIESTVAWLSDGIRSR